MTKRDPWARTTRTKKPYTGTHRDGTDDLFEKIVNVKSSDMCQWCHMRPCSERCKRTSPCHCAHHAVHPVNRESISSYEIYTREMELQRIEEMNDVDPLDCAPAVIHKQGRTGKIDDVFNEIDAKIDESEAEEIPEEEEDTE